MKQRWYDKDPTLSMAISLLQNASRTHQEIVARHMFDVMEDRSLLSIAEQRTKQERIKFVFPGFQRTGFEMHARHLVELMKHLPLEEQKDLAVQMINFVYVLDFGMGLDGVLDEDMLLSQPLARPEIG